MDTERQIVVWELTEAIEIVRDLERTLSTIGYHAGLTGSVLFAGNSEKDLDVIVYPHNTSKMLKHEDVIAALSVSLIEKRDHIVKYADEKDVYHGEYNGRRIDLFFLV